GRGGPAPAGDPGPRAHGEARAAGSRSSGRARWSGPTARGKDQERPAAAAALTLKEGRMELIGRILDGSIPQDLRDALRRAQPSGSRVSHDEKMRHLEEVPLLADCTQKQLRAISDISRVVEVPAGTSLTRAGQPGDEFFFILDGPAAGGERGKKRVFLRPGDFFGEMSLLD